MSIRVKLILTYAILVIVSGLVLIGTGIAIFTYMFTSTAEIVFDDQSPHVIVTEIIDFLSELKYHDDQNPERLTEPDFIQAISSQSDFFNGGIIVEYDGAFYNYNEDIPDAPELYSQLIVYEMDEEDGSQHVVNYGNKRYFYVFYEFREADPVVYYFLMDISNMEILKSDGGRQFFSGILFILIIIMVPLLLIISKDIIRPIRQLEYGVKHIKDGDLDFKLVSKSRNELGDVIRYFDVMREELKASIETQVQFEENRKELISSISHDLKTPITSIKGHVEGIRDGVANTPEKLDKYLSVIYQKSRDMDQLIDDLFLFSKLDLNRLPFEMRQENLGAFLTDIVNEMKLGWEDAQKSLTLIWQGETLMVQMDPQKMKRVFVNIIQNAMKYMDKPNQEIKVILNAVGDRVQCVVADNGQGIPEAQVPHIFDRFYRVDESRNLDTGGTGLGLAISKQIVEQHAGTIRATSVVGQGTKIIIELKLRGEDETHSDH